MTTTTGVVIPEFTVGDRLRKARELTGLDQAAFADEIGISRQSVSNYELGNTKARKIVLIAWQMRTGVPVEWLETGRVTFVPDNGEGRRDLSNAIPTGIEHQPPSTAEIKSYIRKRIPLRAPRPEDSRERTEDEGTPVEAALAGLQRGAVPGDVYRTPVEWRDQQPTSPQRISFPTSRLEPLLRLVAA